MIKYITCPNCLCEGKLRQKPDYYCGNRLVSSIQCSYCGKPLALFDNTEEIKKSLERFISD